VTGRQGRAFRVRTSWRAVTVRRTRPTCQATAPDGPASPVRARRRGARTRPRYLAQPDLVAPASTPASLAWARVPGLGRGRLVPRWITPAHERTDSHLITDRQPHTIITPQPSTTLSYRHGPVSVWESAGRSGSAASGAYGEWRALLSQQVSRREYRLADGKEPRPVRRVNRVRAVLPDGWLYCEAPRS
jgi:hypothetical protein